MDRRVVCGAYPIEEAFDDDEGVALRGGDLELLALGENQVGVVEVVRKLVLSR
jgi:hypothetical protein